jgi:ABC-type cobalamin/Fe3+-siderophores transport system ATPase subunit
MENAMITINEITITRDGREIIYDYSEQIPAGSITVIIGPNGSGKSTLLAAIAGDIVPSKGTITIDELHPPLTSAKELAKLRAMAMQNQFYTLGFSVRQIINMAGSAQEVMEQLHLTHIAERPVTTLSGGESQRVAIAQAIAQKTPVLLLDEPFAAQDVDSRKRIINLLKSLAEGGTTVVVVAHSSEIDLAWADKIIKDFA